MAQTFKDKVTSNFDKASGQYDTHAMVQKQVAERLAFFLPDLKKPRILEIGCGTGFLTGKLIDQYPEADLYITDISEEMLKTCEDKYAGEGRKFFVMDGERPDVEGRFDLIVSSLCFQWFENFDKAVYQLQTKLDLNGRLLFSVLGPETFVEWKAALEHLGLSDGSMDGKDIGKPLAEEILKVGYGSAANFLKNLKYIGAQTPATDHTSLTPTQLRDAMKKCGGDITYHIIYKALTAAFPEKLKVAPVT